MKPKLQKLSKTPKRVVLKTLYLGNGKWSEQSTWKSTQAPKKKKRGHRNPPRICYELWQNGIMVASVDAMVKDANREIQHYAMVFSQDGPVKIVKKKTSWRKP